VTFIYHHLQGIPDQQRFRMRSGVLTANDTGGAVQVAAAHCPNEQNLDPAVRQNQLCPSQSHYGLHPTMFSGSDSLFLVATSEHYQILIAYSLLIYTVHSKGMM